MADDNFWGKLIHQLRTEQKISQRQLATGAKVNRSTLRRVEEGTARGDIDIMERLFNFLGYELEAMTQMSLVERVKKQQELTEDPAARSRLAMQRLAAMTSMDS